MQNHSSTAPNKENIDPSSPLTPALREQLIRQRYRIRRGVRAIQMPNVNYCQPCREALSDKTNNAAFNR